ncbi:MAG: pilus assembly protein TadG-related protein, partial [Actinomycetes bacterium]
AVSVLAAVLMVPLIGFAALAIDVAAMWATRQQLQNGADAGALAIAQACARGACGTPSQTAQELATANVDGVLATGTVTSLSASTVRVETSAVRDHWFAPILGVDQTTLTARAAVRWGSPSRGTAMLPLAFSWCEWKAQTGGAMPSGTTPRTILFPKESGLPCTGPSGLAVPGGFGWLTADAGTCKTTSAISGVLPSDPGNSVPGSCSTGDLGALHNRPVLLPLYDQVTGTGSGVTYRIYGYAAFTITGYHFGGQYSWNKPCQGDDRCIRGYFTRFVDLAESFDYGANAPQLGAAIVSLSE